MNDNYLERKQYTQAIEKRIHALKDGYRQNIALIGDELVGKTTIIFDILKRFYDNRVIVSYLEVRPETLEIFCRRFIAVLLYNFLSNSGIALKEDINFLLDKSEKYIPLTVKKIRIILSALQKRKKNNIFTELLSLTESINQETGKFNVVIFDEFHNFQDIGTKNLYAEWSKLLMLQKNTMYILISSLKFKAKQIIAKDLALLFGNFEILSIGPLDTRESERYIEFKAAGTEIDQGLKNFIVHFTNGCPFYLKIITEALLQADKGSLTEAIEKIIFDQSGILNQRFSNYIKRFFDSGRSRDYISILYLISNGHNKLKEISHFMRRPKKELDSRIAYLLEIDAITKSGDFLKINDRVFGFWIKFVYQEKLNSLTFDAKNQKDQFRNHIDCLLQEFLKSSQKPIVERIEELLRSFDNDIMQLEKKKMRLTHFREIKPLEFDKGGLKLGLIGRSSDSLWVVGFKNDALSDEDIAEFAEECRKFKHKLQKKVIITLNDIDPNAQLRALEEKIWLWDINRLNEIMDLFSKPRVIV
ncbi:MAG: DEAD/DEAH box helicase family protein [Candidatus Omnitrophota bacterium]